MSTRLTVAARVTLVVFAAVTVMLFLVLGARFGGPDVSFEDTTEIRAAVPDAQGIPGQSDVLVRGVKVGRVTGVAAEGDTTRLTLSLDEDAPELHADASMRIGMKTPLGEPFVDLEPGSAAADFDTGEDLPVRDSVEIDEALGVLAPRTRADLGALLEETGTGVADPEAVSATVVRLETATRELRRLGAVLEGQDDDVAATITSSQAVLDELAAHDAALRGLVRDGTATLQAGANRPAELRDAVGRLPALLANARATLDAAEPLLGEAAPLVADVRAAAPDVTALLADAKPALGDARDLVGHLPALREAAGPVLDDVRPLLGVAGPALDRLGPVLANAVPMIRYLEPRSNTIAAWFSNTSALGQNGDAKGKWARFFIGFDPASAIGAPGAPPGNTYTLPGDAADNQPYQPGDFPRLRAYPNPRN